jgi:hypothetical protein
MSGETPAAGVTPAATTPNPTENTPGQTPAAGETPLKWEDWYGSQPDNIKALITEQTSGLKTALNSERGTRGNLERQLNELKKSLKDNESAVAEVQRIQASLAEENTRGEFYEAAHAAGATNLRAAYLLAKADGLIDERGKFRIEDIKGKYPEFFVAPKPATPAGNAGSGAQNPPPALSGNAAVNNLIRGAAGIRA